MGVAVLAPGHLGGRVCRCGLRSPGSVAPHLAVPHEREEQEEQHAQRQRRPQGVLGAEVQSNVHESFSAEMKLRVLFHEYFVTHWATYLLQFYAFLAQRNCVVFQRLWKTL